MGDLQVCSLPQQNGVVSREGHLCPLLEISQPFPASNPSPSSIAEENWERAEQATREIVCRIQPTEVADEKRREVIEYVQGLIRDYLGFEVFPYGSVPLKTYLPDGDIDLTALSSPAIEDVLVSDVHALLRGEEQREDAWFEVKDVQRIDAEVKLVKCLVQNIVVDISFDQLGGLCTLCFLEQVDHLVGKDHLFKRSIILIKAWCYYESRILGAHHGLISTYALETLVLYIFHLFHSSLDGPLAVLYVFLDYFSKFDWENYCISLNGPVCRSSLPHLVAEIPENGGDDLLFSEEFIEKCVQMFSVPSKGIETNSRAFLQKHLNIIDPLKENNNLGRSVNRGNFYRIRSAFKYGARTLGQILLLPRERIADELNKFFANTLERHEGNDWTCLQDPAVGFGAGYSDHSSSSSSSSSSSYSDICFEDTMLLTSLSDGSSDVKISGVQVARGFRNESEIYSSEVVSSQAMPESCCFADGNAVSGCCFTRDAKDESSGCLPLSRDNDALFQRKHHHVPQFYSSGLLRKNEKTQNVNSCRKIPTKSVANDTIYSGSNHECVRPIGMAFSTPDTFSENLSPGSRERELAGIPGSLESSKALLDLSGNYENHLWSVLYGQYCYLFAVPAHVLPHPTISPQLQIKNPWETVQQSLPLKQNFSSLMNADGVSGPEYYPVSPSTPSGYAFNLEEKKKLRGTGTYIPNEDRRSNRDRPSSGRGRFLAPRAQCQRYSRTDGSSTDSQERHSFGESSHELSKEEYPALGLGKSGSSDPYRPHSSVWGSPNANSLSHTSQRRESGSCGLQLREARFPEGSTQPDSATSHSLVSVPSQVVPAAESPKAVPENNQDSVAEESYHLMNEADFPPLAV